ncbi:molybdopterin-dependent oxidoreductase [bacterium]|nr:molybdopterin-dependent oxidoreductase [bacterium]
MTEASDTRAADARIPSDTHAPDPRGVVTTCGGCDAECGFYARVTQDGRVEATLPVEGHPSGARRLCGRGRRRLQLPYLERDRVTHPLRRRSDGTFEEISWEVAYAEIAERLHGVIDAHGPSSLALTTGVPSYHWWYAERFLWALGSPNLYTADAACEASRLTAWTHTLGYSPESDLAHTDCIVYFGRSPMDAASVSMADEIQAAKARGARIVVVDPRRNSTVDYADLWLRVRPGHDLAVLLGIAHVLIDEDLYDHDFVARHTTGFDEFARAMAPYTPAWAAREADVEEADVVRVARALGHARPRAVVDCGFHGGLGVAYVNSTQTSRMVALVDALLGSFGKVGGSKGPSWHLPLGELDPARFPAPPVPATPKVGADRYPMVDPTQGLCTTIGESIELGELHALIAYASNPASGYGNARDWMRMLSDLDLLVAIDIRLSETARIADYVLPEVSYLESDRGVGAMGSCLYYRGRAMDVVHPDARPADRIFRELADACGVGRYFAFTADDLALARVAPYVPAGTDPRAYLDELRRVGYVQTGVRPAPAHGDPVILTPDGRIAFASDEWDAVGQGRVPRWIPPLVEPGPGELRLIGGNNPFASHTSSHMLAGEEDRASRPARDLAMRRGAGAMAGDARADAPAGPGDARASGARAAGAAHADAHAAMASVWLNAARAAELGIRDGDVVEVSSSEGTDRAVARVTDDLHPDALFTTASPGARSGMHARARAAIAGELGVGPLDHTPLRIDPLSGAALTQENVVRVRKVRA